MILCSRTGYWVGTAFARTSRDGFWIFTLEVGLIVYCSRWARSQLGLDSVSANVKLLAVLGVRVGGVGEWAVVVSKHFGAGAWETVGKLFLFAVFRLASLALSILWPGAGALVVIIDEPTGARHNIRCSINTVVEFVANLWIFMGEVAILSWALNRGHSRLKFGTLSTINGEGKITSLMVGILDLKKETVWTQLFLRLVIHTLIVLVTLLWVGKEAIWFWAFEGGTQAQKGKKHNNGSSDHFEPFTSREN
jgi:hypothetical protein